MRPTISRNGGFQVTRDMRMKYDMIMKAEETEDRELYDSMEEAIRMLNSNINHMYVALLQAGIMRRN